MLHRPSPTSADRLTGWCRGGDELPASEILHGKAQSFPVLTEENKGIPACNMTISLVDFPVSVGEDDSVYPHATR